MATRAHVETRIAGIDRRLTSLRVDFRAARAGAPKAAKGGTLAGYAAVFNQETVIAGLFRERIDRGAFAASIRVDDVVAEFNHDPNYVLGRTANGTVRLSEDEKGLRYAVDLNERDPEAQRIAAIIARGDVRGSSFAFSVERDEDEKWDFSPTKEGKLPLRIVKRARLWDVAPVTSPAYAATSVAAETSERLNALRGVPISVLERELELDEFDVIFKMGTVPQLSPRRHHPGTEMLEREIELLELEVLR